MEKLNINKKNYSKYGLIIGSLSLIFGVYTFGIKQKKEYLSCYVSDSKTLEQFSPTKNANDSTYTELSKSISIINVVLKNDGKTNIIKEMFDDDNLAIKFSSEIISIPNIKDASKTVRSNRIRTVVSDSSLVIIEPFLFDSNDFIELELLVESNSSEKTYINIEGKISGYENRVTKKPNKLKDRFFCDGIFNNLIKTIVIFLVAFLAFVLLGKKKKQITLKADVHGET